MCSILCLLDLRSDARSLRERALRLSARLRHRGPDWSGVWNDERAIMVHERLAIVGLEHGAQPLVDETSGTVLAVNGEIYNHRELAAGLQREYTFSTGSDCEIIQALYREEGASLVERLNGIFAFVLFDRVRETFLIARDPIGVVPLYWGRDRDGNLLVASELKALADQCDTFEEFPPGHRFDSARDTEPVRYYQPAWRDLARADSPADLTQLRSQFEAAVARQLMSEVPFGVLLSGGLDSSLVAAVTARQLATSDGPAPWGKKLHTFAIGLEGSPDLAAAQQVATALETQHHTFHFTVQDGLDALPDVIRHIETFDVTTVRASVPMYLLARRIKALGVKMVLSGEGSDEIFGGYLYFHHAPSPEAFHAETVRKLASLSQFDCLRANKSMAAWGVEARVPFLDLEFLDTAMSIEPRAKMVGPRGIEKELLRQAFADLLPADLLWRQKEQFSDGVGYAWIDSLKHYAERELSSEGLARLQKQYSVNPPQTLEGALYRRIFDAWYPGPAAALCIPSGPSIACSSPAAVTWNAAFASAADPSGRAVAIHRASQTLSRPKKEVGTDLG